MNDMRTSDGQFYKTLVFPSEFVDGMYRAPYTRVYKPFDVIQFYHKGKFHVEAFREGDNIYLRRTTGEMGAVRYKGLFLLNMLCLALLFLATSVGTFQIRVMHHDVPEHALLVGMGVGILLFALPAYTIINHCLYPDAKEFSRWYHRDV